MERRQFIGAAAGAGLALGAAGAARSQGPAPPARLYYLLRQYQISPGASAAVCDAYLANALVPAAGRAGMGPVGVFDAWFAPTSSLGKYVFLASPSLEKLARLDDVLAADAAYSAAGAPFLQAPVDRPPFYRIHSTLMEAMPKFPGLRLPKDVTSRRGRIYEFRVYEQPTDEAHRRKMEMFQNGEDEVLTQVGLNAVFYAKNLVGERLPSLSYMWVYDSLDERQKAEVAWGASKDREALFAEPRFQGANSMFGNIILRPTRYSQM